MVESTAKGDALLMFCCAITIADQTGNAEAAIKKIEDHVATLDGERQKEIMRELMDIDTGFSIASLGLVNDRTERLAWREAIEFVAHKRREEIKSERFGNDVWVGYENSALAKSVGLVPVRA